ncbi:MAG: CHAD domain-containing protein [Solirubrobacterales bacterium]
MKAKRVKKLDPRAPLAANAARIVRVRLGELRSFAPAALQEDAAHEQHDMRIAAKRLRYVLEATETSFGRHGSHARRGARSLQGVLGDIHDCDEMLPRVESHLAEMRALDADAVLAEAGQADDLDPRLAARAPHRTSYRGLEVLAVYLQARRRLLFGRFAELWEGIERDGVWDRLELAATRVIREEEEAAPAAPGPEGARTLP